MTVSLRTRVLLALLAMVLGVSVGAQSARATAGPSTNTSAAAVSSSSAAPVRGPILKAKAAVTPHGAVCKSAAAGPLAEGEAFAQIATSVKAIGGAYVYARMSSSFYYEGGKSSVQVEPIAQWINTMPVGIAGLQRKFLKRNATVNVASLFRVTNRWGWWTNEAVFYSYAVRCSMTFKTPK